MLITLAPWMLGTLLSSSLTSGVAYVARVVLLGGVTIVHLIIFIPYLAIVVRRLHDSGKSGFWILITFFPYVGGLILLLFFLQDSDSGWNAYGPDPKSAFRQRA